MDKGWAVYRANPRHSRAKLLEPTQVGRDVVRTLRDDQHAWSNAVGAEVGAADLQHALAIIAKVIQASRTFRGDQSSRGSEG